MFRPNESFKLDEIDVIHKAVASDNRPLAIDLKWSNLNRCFVQDEPYRERSCGRCVFCQTSHVLLQVLE